MSICDQLELASGAKVSRGKSKVMFFGKWADQPFIPFTIGTDYLKVLGIWFGGAEAIAKTREERITKVRPILRTCDIAVTRAILHFIWRSQMDRVCRDNMYKTLEKRGKNVPNVTLILMAPFVRGCIKLCIDPQYKFGKRNTFGHSSISTWSAHSVLETLREKERVDPVAWFPEQTVKVIWQNVSSPELSSKHQDIVWLVDAQRDKHQLHLEDQLSERHSLICPKLVGLPEHGVNVNQVLQTGTFQGPGLQAEGHTKDLLSFSSNFCFYVKKEVVLDLVMFNEAGIANNFRVKGLL
eukprot:g41984.t1